MNNIINNIINKKNKIGIIKDDCLNAMKFIPNNSIDLIICDLPYGQTKNDWDKTISLTKLWEQYERIIKPNGAIILFGQGLFSAKLMLSNEKMYRYSLIWEKNTVSGFLNAKKMPLRSHEDIMIFKDYIDERDFDILFEQSLSTEDILLFYKKLPTYNPIMWEGIPLHSKGKSFKEKEGKNNNYGKYDTKYESNRVGSTEKYPRSVLRFARPHPAIFATQKPIDLCQYLINTFSNENDIILDNCMGSGSSIISAALCNRYAIGIEKNEDNFQLSKSVLEKSNIKYIE